MPKIYHFIESATAFKHGRDVLQSQSSKLLYLTVEKSNISLIFQLLTQNHPSCRSSKFFGVALEKSRALPTLREISLTGPVGFWRPC